MIQKRYYKYIRENKIQIEWFSWFKDYGKKHKVKGYENNTINVVKNTFQTYKTASGKSVQAIQPPKGITEVNKGVKHLLLKQKGKGWSNQPI